MQHRHGEGSSGAWPGDQHEGWCPVMGQRAGLARAEAGGRKEKQGHKVAGLFEEEQLG